MLRSLARRVRHMPGLEGADWLWRFLRQPYHRVLEVGGTGVNVLVGGYAEVRLPAEFVGGDWEKYEPEGVAWYANWVRGHSGGLVLDIGSSTGVFSAVALFADAATEVVAFDSDLNSLAASRRLCRHAPRPQRLRAVHGFVGETATEAVPLAKAVIDTEGALAAAAALGQVGATRYICLGDPESSAIASRRLDDLFAAELLHDRAMLIKCDVEGAELHVLAGAQNLLRRARPALLLSVHPEALPNYGHTKAMVEEFLRTAGYDIQCVGVDHEEHWWCMPGASGAEDY